MYNYCIEKRKCAHDKFRQSATLNIYRHQPYHSPAFRILVLHPRTVHEEPRYPPALCTLCSSQPCTFHTVRLLPVDPDLQKGEIRASSDINELFVYKDTHFLISSPNKSYYRPQRSCGQGNIFAPLTCLSFCSQGGGVCLSACWDTTHPREQTHHAPLEQTHPQSIPPEQTPPLPLEADPPSSKHPPREADSGIRSISGRYASYWNAFLFGRKNFPLETTIRSHLHRAPATCL